jgi:hypothetical protein
MAELSQKFSPEQYDSLVDPDNRGYYASPTGIHESLQPFSVLRLHRKKLGLFAASNFEIFHPFPDRPVPKGQISAG